MAQLTPIVYDPSTTEHRPALSGEQIGAAFVPLDSSSSNLIKQTANGLTVDKGDIDVPLSQQDGNYLRYGSDRGLFLDGNDVLSNGRENLLYIDTTDGKVLLTKQDLIDAGFTTSGGGTITVVSSDANNILSRGTDGGAYLSASAIPSGGGGISGDSGNLLTLGSDNKAYLSHGTIESVATAAVTPASMVSSFTPNALTTGYDGKLVVSPSALKSSDSSNIIRIASDGTLLVQAADVRSTDTGNLLTTGADGKISLLGTNLISADTGNVARTGTDGKVFVPAVTPTNLLAADDKILGVDGSGKLFSALSASFDTATNTLVLSGQGGTTVASVVLPAAASSLERVEVVTNPEGMPAGTYLAMTFRKEDGTTETVYVDMSAVGDVYTAGAGINIVSRVISAKLATNGGLETDASGNLKLTAAAMNPVSVDAGNIISQGTDGKAYFSGDLGTM